MSRCTLRVQEPLTRCAWGELVAPLSLGRCCAAQLGSACCPVPAGRQSATERTPWWWVPQLRLVGKVRKLSGGFQHSVTWVERPWVAAAVTIGARVVEGTRNSFVACAYSE